MRDVPAITLRDVTKTYRLFGSQRHQLMEVLGLTRFVPGLRSIPHREFTALSGVSLAIGKGERVGIVGRNGAGKTTLLKLICGNFAPTSGEIEVNGQVQALMGMGIGFHPDYTGRENVLASLQYNGLSRSEYQAALDDIIDFCELGEFLDQPFKTYSLGMQARLMFAASTAIRPDILIIDEVLGAGDGYFVAKSRQRMEKLVGSGCTMLLVSHSTQQVLEMCQQAVWLDHGQVRMQDEAFRVVKAYEEFVHGSKKVLSLPPEKPATPAPVAAQPAGDIPVAGLAQEPAFAANRAPAGAFGSPDDCRELKFQARGGVSRWASDVGVKVCGFDIRSAKGSSNRLASLQPAEVVLHLQAEAAGHYRCRYGVLFNDIHGRPVSKIFSPLDEFTIQAGELRKVTMLLNPLQLGSGEYTIGVSVLEYGPLETLNATRRFDLLGRSFEVHVELAQSLGAADCLFFHAAEWSFAPAVEAGPVLVRAGEPHTDRMTPTT